MSRNEPTEHGQRSDIFGSKEKPIEGKPAAQAPAPKLRPDSTDPTFDEKSGATQRQDLAVAKMEQLDLQRQTDDVDPKRPDPELDPDCIRSNSKATEEMLATQTQPPVKEATTEVGTVADTSSSDVGTDATPAEPSEADEAGDADAAALEAEIAEQEREIAARREDVERRRNDLLQARRREERRRERAMLEEQRRRDQARRAELLRRRLREKQEEARRLLQEAEALKGEAEALDELQRLPREVEALRRTQEAQRDELVALQRQIEGATRQQQTKAKQQVQVQQRKSFGSVSASSGTAAPYYSPSQPSVSHSAMRHKNNYAMKRRGRSGHSEAVDTTIDVESQQQSSSNRGRFRAQRSAIRPNNPFVSVGLLLRKIATDVLTDQDDGELGHEDTDAHVLVITLLIEAIVGILLALAALAFSLFLYDRFVPTLPTVQNFKKAAFQLVNDTPTLEKFEANGGLKLLDMDEYLSIVQEIRKAKNKNKQAKSTIKSRSEHVAEMKKEMETEGYAAEIPKLISSLQLDYFCGNCVWSKSQKLSCTKRVDSLKETYNTPKFEAMLKAMEKKSCWKSAKEVKEDKKLQARTDLLSKDWDVTKRDFCGDCRWDDNTSCQTRMEFLHTTYKMEVDVATADLMTKSRHCRISYHDGGDNEKLKRFCASCDWGRGWNCGDRAGFLMDQYQNTERMARLSAMETPTCIGEKGVTKSDFCGDCRWDDNTSCQTRMEYLHTTYKMGLDQAAADLMTKSQHCRVSYHDGGDNEKLKRFCASCKWGRGWSCGDRAGFLMDTYKNTERMARLSAMERPTCIREKKE